MKGDFPREPYLLDLPRTAEPATRPHPGQMPIVVAALAIGILLMGVQLWMLTVALELYLGGAGQNIWQIAGVSGLIFLGGLLMLWLLRRRSAPRQPSLSEIPPNAP